jgi:hypothetical protein
MGYPPYGQTEAPRAEARPTPKAWVRQYLGVEFPNSAKHFLLYYRSSDEDVVLFSFDIALDDLRRLLDGKGIFPGYDELTPGGSDLPERIVCDPGSRYFAQRVAALPNALSATTRRTSRAGPLELRWRTGARPAGMQGVCVAVIAEKHADKAIAYGGFQTPGTPQDARSYVIMDSRLERVGDTKIWQRWSLDEAGYREFLRMTAERPDVQRQSGTAAERHAGSLDTPGPVRKLPWWQPSELRQSRAGDSEPTEAFS